MLIDSHCHLDLLEAEGNTIRDVLMTAKEYHVQHLLTVCTRLSSFPKLISIAEDYDCVSTSIGLHPNEIEDHEPTIETLVALGTHPKVIAVGETGLDYYRSQGDLSWQQQRFRTHIAAAKQLKKPLIVHTRQAKDDTLKILEDTQAHEVQGVMHCFSEDWDAAKKALDLGFYISFSGVITFKNAHELREVAKKVPLNRLLVETDSPYLAPEPYRGKRNQPAYVYHVAKFIAQLRDLSFESFAEATTENFHCLFGAATVP